MPANPETFLNLPEEKRKRVLDEATREFAEHGFHQASVNRMVGRLGIAKGSLFKYFGTKQGIFEHLFGHAIELFKAPLKEIRESTRDGDFFERVRRSMLAGLDFIEAHPRLYSIYLKMLYQENFPLREKLLGQIRQASTKFLRGLVEEAKSNGQLRDDLDTDMAVYLLDGVMDRFFQSVSLPFLDANAGLYKADRTTIENRLDSVIAFMKDGLSGTGAS
ncbi:TetR/AcrR family transcriptional regulator [Salidesulfovibrio onnuriiensis]|uniref:TetR/AcrR family transcriptional regulator n=1 Tax=Salidesulfovibrio onnuriiensis TaxID=2583823 RepID=UPI0011C9A365|nr:TetR/AcrR family transcriptional regulator [Salidesulfovibrio onnuriiensis]